MKEKLRAASALLGRHIDARDVAGAIGLCLLCYGGEVLYPGAGFAVAGAVLVGIAVFVR